LRNTALEEVTADWRKVSNEELKDVYFLSNSIWEIRTRSMKWQGM
jgi:hypothetical protein